MLDYMKALRNRFDSLSPDDSEMKEEADLLFYELCSPKERPARK